MTRGLIVNDNEQSGLGYNPTTSSWHGFRDLLPQQGRRDDNLEGSIPLAQAQHPSYGITTDELAEAQRRFSTYARLRLTGVGHTQYDRGDKQAFEDMDLHRLINEMRDELADAVNYLAFMDVQLSRWKTRLESKA